MTSMPNLTEDSKDDLVTEARKVAKAIYAGLFAGLITLGALFVGDMTFDDISAAQWIAVAIAFIGGAGGTYAIPNLRPSA
jgi:uncharacterized membrane-anchored protein